MRETLHIEPMSRHNGMTLTVTGLLLMPTLLAIGYFLDKQVQLVIVFLFLACMIMTLLGILKLREPRYSFSLSEKHLHFHHRVGGWSLGWNDIIRVDQARLQKDLTLEELPYVGIKIRDYDKLLPLMTPRLVVNILTEQRPLLAMALRHGAISRHELQDWLVEDNRYKSADGRIYQGITAMLGNRMAHLRDLYGYDLLIHESSLDRDTEAFVRLLRHYLAAGQSVTPPE